MFEFKEIQYEIKGINSLETKYKASHILLCSRFFGKRYTSTECAIFVLRSKKEYEGLEARLNEDRTYIKNVGSDKTLIIILNPS